MRTRDVYIKQCSESEVPKDAYIRTMRGISEFADGYAGRISSLSVFPGKALGALDVESARLTPWGLSTTDDLFSHSFMIGRSVRKKGSLPDWERFSQRQTPELSLLKPSWDGRELRYAAPGMEDLVITREELAPRGGKTTRVEVVPGEIILAAEEDGPITARIREFLLQYRSSVDDIMVLLRSKEHSRPLAPHVGSDVPQAETYFSDGGQLLLTSTSSLDFINAQMRHGKNGASLPAKMSAIRPNIVVDGWPTNIEDIVASGVVMQERNTIQIQFRALCARCGVILTDTETGGKRKDREPFNSMMATRPHRYEADGSMNKSPTFGVNAVTGLPAWGETIHVGDRIVTGPEKEMARYEVVA